MVTAATFPFSSGIRIISTWEVSKLQCPACIARRLALDAVEGFFRPITTMNSNHWLRRATGGWGATVAVLEPFREIYTQPKAMIAATDDWYDSYTFIKTTTASATKTRACDWAHSLKYLVDFRSKCAHLILTSSMEPSAMNLATIERKAFCWLRLSTGHTEKSPLWYL